MTTPHGTVRVRRRLPRVQPLDPGELRTEAARLLHRANRLLRQAFEIAGHQGAQVRACVDCSTVFEIPTEEIAAYRLRKWDLRARCEFCMVIRRERRKENAERRRMWEARRAAVGVTA